MARIKYGEAVKDKVTKVLVEAFTSLGYYAAIEAYKGHTYSHRTHNLHDSYASAVYVNGVLVDDSIKFVQRSKSSKNDYRGSRWGYAPNGRTAARYFFENLDVSNREDYITIVIAAAMWYAEIVEYNGFVVLDMNEARQYIANNIDRAIKPILSKYNMSNLYPAISKQLGIDRVYYGLEI